MCIMRQYCFPRHAVTTVLGLFAAAVAHPTFASSAPLELAQFSSDRRQSAGAEHAAVHLVLTPTVPEPSQATPGQATPGGDVLLGGQYIGFLTSRNVIRVGNETGKFAKIRLRVIDNEIQIHELKAIYTNGESDTLAVNTDIPKNSRSNWIDLRGDRFIEEIQIVCRSRPSFDGQARVEVFGQYAGGGRSSNVAGRELDQDWILLDAKIADFIGFDDDIIPVGSKGGFSRIRVAVRDRAITLNEVKVVYVGGMTETTSVRSRIGAGGTFGPIELKGETPIDHIEAKYRSRFFDSAAIGKGAAIVEIWGQHY